MKRFIDVFFVRKAAESYRRLVKDSGLGGNLEGEDGGHGSGNWGHKGRPGERGGSGKGGGAQYRGGTSRNYYGSKNDWLNGLHGERQHEIQKWMQTKGSNLAEQEKNILTSGNESDIMKMLKAKAEARRFDDNFERLTDNITEEEEEFIKRMVGQSDNGDLSLENIMTGAKTPEEKTAAANVLNKMLSGESHWSGELPVEKPKSKFSWITEKNDDKHMTQRALCYTISEITGKKVPYNELPTEDQVQLAEDIALTPDYFKSAGKRKLMFDYLSRKGDLLGFETLLNGDSDIAKQMRDILEQGKLSGMNTYWQEMSLLKNSTTNPEAFQKYMSLKSQLLGGPEIAGTKTKTGTGKSKAATPATCVAPTDSKTASAALKKAASLSTTQEITDAIAASGAFRAGTSVNLGHIDPKLAQGIASVYGSVVEDFPFMVGNFGNLESAKMKGAYASCGIGSNHIEVSSTWYKDKAKMQAQLNYDISLGFHPANTEDPNSVITHEVGHAVNNTLTTALQKTGVIAQYSGTRASDILIERVCKKTGMSPSECRASVSGYAKKNSSEWMSEAFAEYRHSSQPREICKVFYSELQSLIKEAGLS